MEEISPEITAQREPAPPKIDYKEKFATQIQGYRNTLSKCFDESGSFKVRRRIGSKPEGQPEELWEGSRILESLLDERHCAEFQALFLGLTPLFFINSLSLNQQKWTQLTSFAKETGSFMIHKDESSAYAAISNPDRVREVIESNSDVFDDYSTGDETDFYLDRAIFWHTLDVGIKPRPNLPSHAFWAANPNVRQGYIEEKEHGLIVNFNPSDCRMDALRRGLLLGFPRAVLEKIVDNSLMRVVVEHKIDERNEELNKSFLPKDALQEEYRNLMFLTSKSANPFGRGRSFYDKFFPNLTDEEKDFLVRTPRAIFDARVWFPKEEFEFKQLLKRTIRFSGIGRVQKEFTERYRQLKMRGLIGVLRKVMSG